MGLGYGVKGAFFFEFLISQRRSLSHRLLQPRLVSSRPGPEVDFRVP